MSGKTGCYHADVRQPLRCLAAMSRDVQSCAGTGMNWSDIITPVMEYVRPAVTIDDAMSMPPSLWMSPNAAAGQHLLETWPGKAAQKQVRLRLSDGLFQC